jgi:exosortase
MNAVVRQNIWRPLAVVAALIFVYWSVLLKLGNQWWVDENYSHGLLIPFIIGYILWTERDRFFNITQPPQIILGGVVILFALLALWAGTAGAELYVQRMSFVLILAGITLYFLGFYGLRIIFVPLVLLILSIPIPAIIFNKIAFPLQLFASQCAVWAMRLFNIPVLREGNVIELMPLGATHTKKLEVVEACSGIRSLMTLITLAVVFAYFTYPSSNKPSSFLRSYGFWRSFIIVLSSIPIAIFTNALRVSGTGILSRYYGTEVADGFFHSFSGWVVYVVALSLLFAVNWLLDRIGKINKTTNVTVPVIETAESTK